MSRAAVQWLDHPRIRRVAIAQAMHARAMLVRRRPGLTWAKATQRVRLYWLELADAALSV